MLKVLVLQEKADKFAIGVSLLCALHCAVLPSLWVLIPTFGLFGLDSEAVHLWMLVVVIPVSAVALTTGARKHGRYSLMILGIFGLLVLAAAVILGEHNLGQFGEKLVTVIGSVIVAGAHLRNYRFCRDTDCQCHTD